MSGSCFDWFERAKGGESSDVLALEVVYEKGTGVPVGDLVFRAAHLECVRFGGCLLFCVSVADQGVVDGSGYPRRDGG